MLLTNVVVNTKATAALHLRYKVTATTQQQSGQLNQKATGFNNLLWRRFASYPRGFISSSQPGWMRTFTDDTTASYSKCTTTTLYRSTHKTDLTQNTNSYTCPVLWYFREMIQDSSLMKHLSDSVDVMEAAICICVDVKTMFWWLFSVNILIADDNPINSTLLYITISSTLSFFWQIIGKY